MRPRSYAENLVRLIGTMTAILACILLVQYIAMQSSPFGRSYFGAQLPWLVGVAYIMCFVMAYAYRYRTLILDRPFSEELINEVVIGASYLAYRVIANTDSEAVLAPEKSMLGIVGPISIKPRGESGSIVTGPSPVLDYVRKRLGGEVGAVPKDVGR